MPDPAEAPPPGGWAGLAPELLVSDLDASLAFWRDILGFAVAYRRVEQRFVYLELAGAQVMLRQRDGSWETGSLEPPYGRGAMFQIATNDFTGIVRRLHAAAWPVHTGPREVWRRTGERETGQHEVVLQDPDGYLVMMYTDRGSREPS